VAALVQGLLVLEQAVTVTAVGRQLMLLAATLTS
jgi:hypothetical protein